MGPTQEADFVAGVNGLIGRLQSIVAQIEAAKSVAASDAPLADARVRAAMGQLEELAQQWKRAVGNSRWTSR